MKDRRKLLKALSIAGTAGTLEAWKKPTVKSIVLPAHANTSCELCFTFSSELTGDFDGFAAIEIFPLPCAPALARLGPEAIGPGVTNVTECVFLAPGDYDYFGNGFAGGSSGSAQMSYELSCCGDRISGSGNFLIGGTISIAENRTCSITPGSSQCE